MSTKAHHFTPPVVPVIAERDGDNTLLRKPIPRTKRQKREVALALRHFWIEELAGCNPHLRCWCGAHLELDYFAHGIEAMTTALNAFLDEHGDCPAPSAPRETP